MIVPMRHVTIISPATLRRITLAHLREMGVVHLTNQKVATIVPELKTRIERCRKALSIAADFKSTYATKHINNKNINKRRTNKKFKRFSQHFAEKIAEDIIESYNSIIACQEKKRAIKHQLDALDPWGGYNHTLCTWLQERGIYCHFYILNSGQYREMNQKKPDDLYITIRKKLTQIYLVRITFKPNAEHLFKPYAMPGVDTAELRSTIPTLDQTAHTAQRILRGTLFNVRLIEIALQRLLELNEVTKARHALNWSQSCIYLNGFIPATHVEEMRATAKAQGWGIIIRAPHKEEEVPTYIHNPPVITTVNPLLQLLGATPSYREPDISMLFLGAFTLFFALIIGDGGYALLLAAASLLLWWHGRRQVAIAKIRVAQLLVMCSISTLVWGALSGNWFGVQQITDTTWLGAWVVPQLDVFSPRSIPFVQWFCFVLATIHLGIARIWRMARLIKAKHLLSSVGQLGWLLVIMGLYSLVVRLILGSYNYWYIPGYTWLISSGLGMVVLFNYQVGVSFGRGILEGVKSLFNTFLEGISSFADIISYLRLFAVGLASVEIARSFNQLALTVADGALGWGAGIIVIIIGHTLNIALGALALIVHGVRLNMLEFSSHLGIEWSGKRYAPFQKRTVQSRAT